MNDYEYGLILLSSAAIRALVHCIVSTYDISARPTPIVIPVNHRPEWLWRLKIEFIIDNKRQAGYHD